MKMAAVVAQEEQPISRTYQYRKVMKPMLERKRRARINRCLDELKELLVGALQAEGESVSRLEKADVLELTVRHLHKLRRSQQISESSAGERFRAGFVHCANEVSKYITSMTNPSSGPAPVDISVSTRVVGHLEQCIRHLESSAQLHHQMIQQQQVPQGSPSQLSPVPGYPGGVPASLISPMGAAPVVSGGSGHGLNILTTYTPPSSPINSPNQNGHHPSAKLYAYIPGSSASTGSQSSPASSTGSLSPIPPAHLNHPFAAHLASAINGGQQPLSLCTKSPNPDEPLNLSDNVWRPW